MTRHYYANPSTRAVDPREWVEGRYINPSDPLPNGRGGFNVRHIPEWDLYVAIEDNTLPGRYERWSNPDAKRSLVLEGTVNAEAARVRETADIVPLTLDEVFAVKTEELRQYTDEVSQSAFQHDPGGGLELWATGDQGSRNARGAYNGYLSNRIADQLTNAIDVGIANGAGNVNAEVAAFWAELKKSVLSGNGQLYWDRDIKVILYDRLTLKQVRDNANQAQWSGLAESLGTFDWQWRNANGRVWDDMVAAYDDSDVLQLQLIDVADPIYNWPPHYNGPWAPGRVTVAELMAR